MALYAYIRVSSENQAYDRQLYQFNEYFDRCGIDKSKVTFIEEKITSYTSFKQRAIYPYLKKASKGDIFYACQVDRFGRTVEDLFQLVDFADERDIELQALKESIRVTRKTAIGKLLLAMMATAAEMERDNFAERRKYGIKAAREELKQNGSRIARVSGKVQTRWGNEKGTTETKRIMDIAREASIAAKQDKAILWRQQSPAYQLTRELLAMGKSRNDILAELERHYRLTPEQYCTSNKKCVTRSVLDRWCREMGMIVA